MVKIAEAENRFWESEIEGPMSRAGLTAQQIIDLGAQAGLPLQETASELVRLLHRRHLHRYAMQTYVRRLERAMEEAGVVPRKPTHPEAIAFVDLTGFTRLTEQRGDEAAAALGQALASLVQRAARSHGGRMVKLLGDGAMLYFADPRDAVLCALDLLERVSELDLPPARIGLDAGRVIHQDGDYYGRTVNVAARVADRAGPGEVLVTPDIVVAVGDDVSFTEVGPVMLKGLDEPLVLHRAARK
jgi:adenylate cyclase